MKGARVSTVLYHEREKVQLPPFGVSGKKGSTVILEGN